MGNYVSYDIWLHDKKGSIIDELIKKNALKCIDPEKEEFLFLLDVASPNLFEKYKQELTDNGVSLDENTGHFYVKGDKKEQKLMYWHKWIYFDLLVDAMSECLEDQIIKVVCDYEWWSHSVYFLKNGNPCVPNGKKTTKILWDVKNTIINNTGNGKCSVTLPIGKTPYDKWGTIYVDESSVYTEIYYPDGIPVKSDCSNIFLTEDKYYVTYNRFGEYMTVDEISDVFKQSKQSHHKNMSRAVKFTISKKDVIRRDSYYIVNLPSCISITVSDCDVTFNSDDTVTVKIGEAGRERNIRINNKPHRLTCSSIEHRVMQAIS